MTPPAIGDEIAAPMLTARARRRSCGGGSGDGAEFCFADTYFPTCLPTCLTAALGLVWSWVEPVTARS